MVKRIIDTPLVGNVASQQGAEDEKRGSIVEAALTVVGGFFGGPAGAKLGSKVGERAKDERTKSSPGSSLLKRSTRGSKPFTASEIKQGFRKL